MRDRTSSVVLKGLAPIVVVLLLAGCGGDAEEAGPPPTRTLVPATPTHTPIPQPSMSPTPTPTDLPSAWDIGTTPTPVSILAIPADAERFIPLAIADLAERRNVDQDDIRLLSIEAFTWPDAALGCTARADDETRSTPTPGYRVLLGAGSRVYAYHTDRGEIFFLCDDPAWLAQEGQPLPIDPVARSMADLTLTDAAQRLGVAEDQITLASLLPVDWPDTSLGCPKLNGTYADQEIPGYRIVLRADAQALIYHTSIRDFVVCAPQEEILPGALHQALPTPIPTPEPTP